MPTGISHRKTPYFSESYRRVVTAKPHTRRWMASVQMGTTGCISPESIVAAGRIQWRCTLGRPFARGRLSGVPGTAYTPQVRVTSPTQIGAAYGHGIVDYPATESKEATERRKTIGFKPVVSIETSSTPASPRRRASTTPRTSSISTMACGRSSASPPASSSCTSPCRWMMAASRSSPAIACSTPSRAGPGKGGVRYAPDVSLDESAPSPAG